MSAEDYGDLLEKQNEFNAGNYKLLREEQNEFNVDMRNSQAAAVLGRFDKVNKAKRARKIRLKGKWDTFRDRRRIIV